jgi:D-glycero-alpha-D-manno-heptose-7-phosphate kinase
LRLSLGGGGTDLPTYYSKYGGFFVSAAVDKYVFVAVSRRFERNSLRISYSKTEIVGHVKDIKHPIVKEALKLVGIDEGIEIVSVADAPASTGLGSSGSFCVGLLKALHSYLRDDVSAKMIAEEACELAMNKLKEPSGKQDEYISSYGGICSFEIDKEGDVTVVPINLSTHTLAELEASILMFYTGITRKASGILAKQQNALSKREGLERMHKIKAIGLQARDALVSGDLNRFGNSLHEHWLVKRGFMNEMSSDEIDKWYKLARKNGALGGKIVGAGGGGFLMLFCEDGRQELRRVMERQGLQERRFRFDFEGAKIIYNV